MKIPHFRKSKNYTELETIYKYTKIDIQIFQMNHGHKKIKTSEICSTNTLPRKTSGLFYDTIYQDGMK